MQIKVSTKCKRAISAHVFVCWLLFHSPRDLCVLSVIQETRNCLYAVFVWSVCSSRHPDIGNERLRVPIVVL